MIQFRTENRDEHRAIKREEDEELEKPAKKIKIEAEKATTNDSSKEVEADETPAPKITSPKKTNTKTEIQELAAGKERTTNNFYITSGKVLCGDEHDIFAAVDRTAPDHPTLSGTVYIRPLMPGFPVKEGKWTYFESKYLQAFYHESINSDLMNADYLGELAGAVFKGDEGETIMDFRVFRKVGRYDWGMHSDPDTECAFFHFIDQEKAELVRQHNTLGQDFWDEAWNMDLSGMTTVWSDPEGGGVCWHPEEEYKYGFFFTSKGAPKSEPTLFVVSGYEAMKDI